MSGIVLFLNNQSTSCSRRTGATIVGALKLGFVPAHNNIAGELENAYCLHCNTTAIMESSYYLADVLEYYSNREEVEYRQCIMV